MYRYSGSLALHAARRRRQCRDAASHGLLHHRLTIVTISALAFSPQRPTGFAQQGPWQLAWRQVRQTRAAWHDLACTHARMQAQGPFLPFPQTSEARQAALYFLQAMGQPSPVQASPRARLNHRQTARPPLARGHIISAHVDPCPHT